MIDDGYIGTTAVRLDEASQELRGIYETFGVLPPDRSHRAYGFYTNLAEGMPFYGPSVEEEADARADWIVRSFLPSLAEESLKYALAGGQLPVWTADDAGERARDHYVLFAPSACNWSATLATGRYIPVQGQPATPPSYVHARLWVKHDDWTVFRAHIVRMRGGMDGNTLLNAFAPGAVASPEQLIQTDQAPAARGRPRGSGYDRMDASIVEQMLTLKRAGQVKSLTEAARHFADQTTGASRDAIIRRLQRAATARERKGE